MTGTEGRNNAYTHDTVNGHNFAENDAAGCWHKHRTRNVATHLIKFFVLMRGARTPPPRIEAPVMKIPLQNNER